MSSSSSETMPDGEKHYAILHDEVQEVYLVRPGTSMFEAMSGAAAPNELADGSVVSEIISAEKSKRQATESEDHIVRGEN